MSASASSSPEKQIRAMYRKLAQLWGPQHWWPAQSRFEVIVGAYLTQNTNWSNVETAIRNLRKAGILRVAGIRDVPIQKLEMLIRSSGYFHQKSQRLKAFVSFLDVQYDGSLTRMFAQPTTQLREQLLALEGVGPETADSILLYAGQHSIFVVDGYTQRLAARHGLSPENVKYDELRQLFECALTGVVPVEHASRLGVGGACHTPSRMSVAAHRPTAQVYNEMHGLIVGVGKQYCFKSKPDCEHCPLRSFLPQPSI